jgi:hypothetical protein
MRDEGKKRYTLSSRGDLCDIYKETITDAELGPVNCLVDGIGECSADSVRWLVAKLRSIFDTPLRTNTFKLVIVRRDIPCYAATRPGV